MRPLCPLCVAFSAFIAFSPAARADTTNADLGIHPGPATASTGVSPGDSSEPTLTPETDALPTLFADEGWHAISIRAGAAFAHSSTDGETAVTFHLFLAPRLEFDAGLAGWYYDQDGPNAAGINPQIDFRYHFLMPSDQTDRSWSVYAAAGIGVLFADHAVPDGGTHVNFTPRAGIGATFAVGAGGTRLDVGVGWAHVSNGSFRGSDDNPSRDSLNVYLGVIFPF